MNIASAQNPHITVEARQGEANEKLLKIYNGTVTKYYPKGVFPISKDSTSTIKCKKLEAKLKANETNAQAKAAKKS